MTSNSHFSGRAGRAPVHYSPELAERICEHLRAGRSLGAICKDEGMPSVGTVQQWVRENRNGFAARYMHARGERGIKPGILPAYTKEMAMRICLELSAGRSLRDVCRDAGMPNTKTVQRWVRKDYGGFAARYRTAREAGYHAMADEIIDIANASRPGQVEEARLRVGPRRWTLARTLPKMR